MSNSYLNLIVLAGCLFTLLSPEPGKSAPVIFRELTAKQPTPDASQIAPTRQYSHGEPSSDEQYLLELVNRCRANPFNEANLICDSPDSHIQQGLVVYEIDTDQLLREFAAYDSKPPLAFNIHLLASAKAHSEDMAANDFQGHVSTDGSTLTQRFGKVGYSYRAGGENVFSYAHSAFYAQAAFLVDWGVPDLGHRINLLDLGDHTGFREVGISIIPEDNPATAVGPLVITQDFGAADPQTVFITGVLYRDNNKDNFYDAGEGLADVTVMPNHGEYFAVTSQSGGFAIPVAANSGEYVLKTTRSDLPEMTAVVTVADQNVKVDFPLGNPAFATVEGTVVDAATNQLLRNAKVTISPINRAYTTNADGYFVFSDLPAASYTVHAELNGYTFHVNDFSVTLAAAQSTRLRLMAYPGNATPTPTPPDSDVTNPPIGTGCAPAGIPLIALLTLAFGAMTERRR